MRMWGRVLLLAGLFLAFCLPVMAADVKVQGEYYAAGMYIDSTSLKKEPSDEGVSTSFYFQRLRLQAALIVAPGLLAITRADMLKRAWGANRSDAATSAFDTLSAGTRAENENIAFDLAYIIYVSPIGVFLAGYQGDGYWGTVFGDSNTPRGKIIYVFKQGPAMSGFFIAKDFDGENSRSAVTLANDNPHIQASDRDCDIYGIFGKYTWKDGEAGVLGSYLRAAGPRIWDSFGMKAYQINVYKITPYVRTKIGPVDVQSEFTYVWGKAANFETPGAGDIDLSNMAGWVHATADAGAFYAGASVAYVSGDDPGTPDRQEGGSADGGLDWNPCLIMWNSERSYWAGSISGYDGTKQSGPMTNAWFFQIRGGVRPVDQFDVTASVSYAVLDKKYHPDLLYSDYGWEVDFITTYKITNNLSWMLGGGYLFAGKFYKGFSDINNVRDDFLVAGKLKMTF